MNIRFLSISNPFMKNSRFPQMHNLNGFIAIFLLLVVPTSHAITRQKPNSDLANQFLAPQNAARFALRMRPLIWDQKLANFAQWYANQRRMDCELQHSNGPYGENIFWGSGSDWTAAQAVSSWLSERKWYRYWSNSCYGDEDCGHYTQIVWRNTARVGCARVVCFGGKGVFITCNYDPPGNYLGEKPY